jgi:hypothetical protein
MADTLGQKQSNGIWLKYSDSKLEYLSLQVNGCYIFNNCTTNLFPASVTLSQQREQLFPRLAFTCCIQLYQDFKKKKVTTGLRAIDSFSFLLYFRSLCFLAFYRVFAPDFPYHPNRLNRGYSSLLYLRFGSVF